MDQHTILIQLETAANALTSNSGLLQETRQTAENVFLNFHKTPSAFNLCKYILENSQSDYVRFQAVTLLSKAIIREWRMLNQEQKASIQRFIMEFVTTHPNAASYVREKSLCCLAVMAKRATLDHWDNPFKGTEELMAEVSNLISSGNPLMQSLGCSLMSALMSEFASTTHVTDVGLPWEVHAKAKKNFERYDLKKIFEYCLQGLSELSKLDPSASQEAYHLLKKFLHIADQVLNWNFQFPLQLSRKLVTLFETQTNPILRPGRDWGPLFMNKDLLDLFFNLYMNCRNHQDLLHHCIQCLFQLSSLNGLVIQNREERLSYLNRFTMGLLRIISTMEFKEYEITGLCHTIFRLCAAYSTSQLSQISLDIVEPFLNKLNEMTCLIIKKAAEEEMKQAEDQIYMEAFGHLIMTWHQFLFQESLFAIDSIKTASVDIFNHYIQYHLVPPEGMRTINLYEETLEDFEEDDRIKFKNHLNVIGAFGRYNLEHSLSLLTKLLEPRIDTLRRFLENIHQQNNQISPEDFALLSGLHEDLHWLIMVLTHLIVVGSDGEMCLIPKDIVNYSVANQHKISAKVTMEVLANLSKPAYSMINADSAQPDPIVRIISDIFRLCEIQKLALEADLGCHLSPEVSLSLLEFINHWVKVYLMPTEQHYSDLSPSILEAFGRDTQSSRLILSFLLQYLNRNLTHWYHEPKIAMASCSAIVAALSADKPQNLQQESINFLLERVTNCQNLPTMAKRCLLKGVVYIGRDSSENYWEIVFLPFKTKLASLADHNMAFFHQEEVKTMVVDLVECLMGIAEGFTRSNMKNLVVFLFPAMTQMVRLVEIYSNYNYIQTSIFQFFSIIIRKTLGILPHENCNELYQNCISLINIYVKSKNNIYTIESTAEEDQCQDLLYFMQMLSDLLSRDIIDAVNPNVSENNVPVTSPVDVTLYGITILLPLMSIDLLRFPKLCSQYYKLITFAAEMNVEKLCQIPDQFFNMLLQSVQIGLRDFPAEIINYCFDFILVISKHFSKTGASPAKLAFEPFIKIVLDLILTQPVDQEILHTSVAPVHSLACAYPESFRRYFEELITSQQDISLRDRLLNAYNKLMDGLEFKQERQYKNRFKTNFDVFILDVRGFLCIM